MGAEPRITVDEELFLGRLEEQDIFRNALHAVLDPQEEDAPPFIFLLHGEGGMGKSKLARRFRDIAAQEVPFEGGFHVLLVDWELERDRSVTLQVGRDAITTETVFDTLHRACIDARWGRQFRAYQNAVKRRQQAEQEVARALDRETGESRYAAVRDLGAAGLAKLVRLGLPIVGDTGEALTKALLSAGIQVGAEQAAHLRQSADDFLRARLKPQYYDVFHQPNETLARALARGLKRVSADKPVVLLLDTYEIVARADPWLRVVIQHAGPRAIWVVVGRHNLAANRPADHFLGYSAEFPQRLIVREVRELSADHVWEYLRDRAPARETTRQDAETIHRATLGVPLAVQAAADLWLRGIPLSGITGGIPDRAPRDEIVRLMTRRVLVHCDDPADRRALYFLAMQRRPDAETLTAALHPEGDEPFDLTAHLDHLARCYSAVQLEGGASLHAASGAFVREYLLTAEAHASDEVRSLAQRAVKAVRARRQQLEADLPLLEERYESDDWQEATLDLVHWLLWHDEHAAWHEATPRLIEGLGYAPDLCRGLLEVIEGFRPALGRDGRKRLDLWRAGLSPRGLEDVQRLLDELTRWVERAAPEDTHNRERRAILSLHRGQLLHRCEQYAEALAALQRARQLLPAEGEALKRQLGGAFCELSGSLIWPGGAADAAYSSEGEQAVTAAIELIPDLQGAHYRLGAIFARSNRLKQAIAAFQRAIALDPQDALPQHGLGNVYRTQGQHEQAIAAYQRALEMGGLPDKGAKVYNGLGNVYGDLGQHEQAITAFQRAIALDPNSAYPHNNLGNVYRDLGQHEQAIAAFQRAIGLDPMLAAVHYNLGLAYADLGRYEEAIAAYERAIELDPTAAVPHNNLGNVYRDLGQHEQAIAAYERAIELDPKGATPHQGLGVIYHLSGRHDEAISAYQRAIELDPNGASFRASLAAACRALGRQSEYEEHTQRARELMANEVDYNKACIESIAGNVDAALAHLAQALEKAPGDRAWARRDPDLAFIRDDPRFWELVGWDDDIA